MDDAAWSLPHRPQAAGAAREVIAAVLADWHVDEEASEAALLVVSELVTNAVEHARPPLALHLIREPDHLQFRVEVADGGPAVGEGAWTASCEADEHGRGMAIIDAVTTAHGTRPHPQGTTHWAALPTTA
ncbi:ATP-binding protein [Streptomyces sp. NBC_01092]|uniref:ATP-binding protein n=1 Tax=Streptomyces sp. NBC_01092 TaxID=2903748 RepID=UPI00387035D7|nr:ATP-binding protein [Streptomyces sp. NBC_01092]WSU55667.1 ATP-binding protein [Streptomyces sp. NBC_01092]